jgi:hypothetical protein
MNQTRTLISLYFGLAVLQANAQSTNQSTNTKTEMTTTINSSTEPVKAFFTAFGNGDFNGIINAFHEDCSITAVRQGKRTGKEIFGTYTSKEGAKEFISNLGNSFDTKAFSVDHIVGEDNVAFANGKFTHHVKSTGKPYSSDWSLMCVIKDGKIFEYHFYEDSASFVTASAQ